MPAIMDFKSAWVTDVVPSLQSTCSSCNQHPADSKAATAPLNMREHLLASTAGAMPSSTLCSKGPKDLLLRAHNKSGAATGGSIPPSYVIARQATPAPSRRPTPAWRPCSPAMPLGRPVCKTTDKPAQMAARTPAGSQWRVTTAGYIRTH